MDAISSKRELSGHITVPGSKSHTIRALLLASLAEGTSHIYNPLPSADCLSTGHAVPLIGASIEFGDDVWTVKGAGKNVHLPDDVVNVGNSGSLLYFLSAIAATFDGTTIFTGDSSIRKRPVAHVVDALNQLGAHAETAIPGHNGCPLLVKGPVSSPKKIITEGSVSSQYITGLMMTAPLLNGTLEIELTDPKETPYLTMTQKWLQNAGVKCEISPDYHHITVQGPKQIDAFETTIPSDWEAVAFPLMAALITDSEIVIDNIDGSGTQGDDAIVKVLKSVGADIEWNREKGQLTVRGMKKARNGTGRLTTTEFTNVGRPEKNNTPGLEHWNKELHVNLSGYPDAICAMAAISCFIEGTVYLEDIAVCRRKETDRIKVLKSELEKLGAEIEEGPDFMIIHGHSPVTAEGNPNPEFKLHGGTVESYDDHRVAMALSCLGLGLPEGEEVTVKNAECCSVSFPGFYDKMNSFLNAQFKTRD